jgi:molecular chaperone HtpG
MKNIQIGNEGIIEELSARSTSTGSDRRLQRWAVGEIFITNAEVVPNARRDGFEDNQAWRNIQADIEEIAKRIVKYVRGASKTRKKIKNVEAKIASTRARLAFPLVTKRIAGEVDQDLRRQLLVLEKSTAAGVDRKEVSQLIGQIKEIREQLQSRELKDDVPATPAVPTRVERQLSPLEVVEQVLIEQLGAARAQELMALIRARM